MKIYVVTSGEYSDYTIEAIYTDREMAYAYANIDTSRQVEEYDSDIVRADQSPLYAMIVYYPKQNKLHYINTTMRFRNRPEHDHYNNRNDRFQFYCIISDRTRKDIEKNGLDSTILLKAAQDRWAKYKWGEI